MFFFLLSILPSSWFNIWWSCNCHEVPKPLVFNRQISATILCSSFRWGHIFFNKYIVCFLASSFCIWTLLHEKIWSDLIILYELCGLCRVMQICSGKIVQFAFPKVAIVNEPSKHATYRFKGKCTNTCILNKLKECKLKGKWSFTFIYPIFFLSRSWSLFLHVNIMNLRHHLPFFFCDHLHKNDACPEQLESVGKWDRWPVTSMQNYACLFVSPIHVCSSPVFVWRI